MEMYIQDTIKKLKNNKFSLTYTIYILHITYTDMMKQDICTSYTYV